MKFGIQVFSLCLTLLLISSAVAQPPGIDGNRWTSAASAQAQGFGQGAPLTLTWGFASAGTSLNDQNFSGFANANNNLQSRLNTIYGSQAVWQPLFQSVFDRWSSISGLSYVYEANDDGAQWINANNTTNNGILGVRADVRIAGKALDGNSGVLAYNYFPNFGDMIIDTNDNFFSTTTSNSIRLRNVVAHEHGHGLGMEHVFADNSNILMEPLYSESFDGPQYHDILVAQRAYGDATEKSNAGLGNDIVTRSTSLGTIVDGGSASVGDSARTQSVAPNATDFVSIDDNTDTDFWSFSVNSAGNVDILLESLGFTYLTQPQDPNTGGRTGTNLNFDTTLRSNLALALFDSNGLLSSVNLTGLGGDESISNFALNGPGTYFVRITGADNADANTLDTQFYGLTVSFVSNVPEPGSLMALGLGMALVAASRRRRS